MEAIERRMIGPFQLSLRLAKGGMAEVFVGQRPGNQALVVVKLLNEKSQASPQTAKLFLAEGRIMSGLDHPNVIRIIEHGFHESQAYIAMEYLAGDHLGALIKTLAQTKEKLDPAAAAHLFLQVARGLTYFHSAKDGQGSPLHLVHRDISPQNIFICVDGTVKLLDFGVALRGDKSPADEKGKLRGKTGYMSPEQVLSKGLDQRSDIFSSGIVMWEALTGKRLFKRKSQLTSLKAICQEDAYPIAEYREDLPKELAYIVTRCLHREPEKRFQKSLELQRALQGFTSSRAGRIEPEQLRQLIQQTLGKTEEARAKAIQTMLQGGPAPNFDEISSISGSVHWSETSFSLPPADERLPQLGEGSLSDGDPVMALREALNKGAPQLTLQAYREATAHGDIPNLDARLALKLADILERENLALDAARMCRAAAEKNLDGALAPEAILRAAELLLGPADKPETGVSMLRFLLQRFPDHHLSSRAMTRLRAVYTGDDRVRPSRDSSINISLASRRKPRNGARPGRILLFTGAGLLLLFLLAFLFYFLFPEYRHYLNDIF